MKANQFSLRALFVVVAYMGLVCALVKQFGVRPILLPILLAMIPTAVIVVWSYAYRLAPEATKYLTVGLVLVTCLFSLGSKAILQSRERARRNQFLDSWRQFGTEGQRVAQFQRGSGSERWAKACQILESRQSTPR